MSQIYSTAQHYLRTPFVLHGRCAAGLDCIGLIMIVAKRLSLKTKHNTNFHDLDQVGYYLNSNSLQLHNIIANNLQHTEQLHNGCLLLMDFEGNRQHLAFCGDETIIHANLRHKRVTEERLSNYIKNIHSSYIFNF